MIFTVLTDAVLNASVSFPKILYTCIWYIIDAFLVFTIHDFIQQIVARGIKCRPTCNPIRQLRVYENWISAVCIALFWVGWKKTIDTEGLSRPKKMLTAICGPLTCGVLCIPAYAAMWALDKISAPDIFTVPLSALFTVCLLIGIFSLFFLPPCDGGTFIAQILPWDIRDKFFNFFDNNIGMVILVVGAAILAQQGVTREVFEHGFSFFGNLWIAIFGG